VAGGQRVTTARGHARGGALLAAGLLAGLLLPAAGPGAAATTAPTSTPAATPAGSPVTTPTAATAVRAQVSLTAVSPAAVQPRATIVVSGRVTNRGTAPLPAGRVSIRLNPANLKTREAVRTWTAKGSLTDTRQVAGATAVPALPPGASAAFTLRVRAADLDLPARGEDWGPRGIAVEATAGAARAGFTRTTIVWFPRKEFNPTQLTLVAPVTAPRDTDVSAPSEALAESFAPGGSQARALDAASDPAIAWAVDPALLQAARAVAGQDTAAGGTPAATPTATTGAGTPTPSPPATTDPAERAAAEQWLERVRGDRGQRDLVMLPFGDPDLVAVTRSDPRGQQGPLDAVGQRGDKSGKLGGHPVGHLVQHCVPRQIHVLGESAPQSAEVLRRRVPVASRVGIGPPVGGFAVSVLTDAAPFAVETPDVMLDEDAVAFLHAVQALELLPCHRDGADVLVPHDHRVVERRLRVHLHVCAADACHLDLQQGGIVGQHGHRQFP